MDILSHERLSLSAKIRATALAASLLLVACTAQESSAPEATQSAASLVEPTIMERPLTEAEALVQHRAATVQLRTISKYAKGGDISTLDVDDLYDYTAANCSATHVGQGWFATAGHCIQGQFEVTDQHPYPAQPAADVYDVATLIPDSFSAWQEESDGWKQVGQVDNIIINGNYSQGDFALVHVTGGEALPTIKVADTEPISTNKYFVTGYPGIVNHQMQYPVEYKGSLFIGAVPDQSFGLSNDVTLNVFKQSPDTLYADTLCAPGTSGASVIDAQAEAYGVLSRIGYSDTALGAVFGGGKDTDTQVYCGFMPISDELIDSYKSQKGQLAQENAYIVHK